MKTSITKEITFDSAHHLGNGYKGKCANVHGHTYHLFITITLREGATLDEFGFIMDFSKLKEIWEYNFALRFDHQDLNITVPQPTAENIARKLFEEMRLFIDNESFFLERLKLYETPTSYAEVSV